jgi:hypothetical protein
VPVTGRRLRRESDSAVTAAPGVPTYGSGHSARGAAYRVPAGSTPLDHTSILKTVEQRWNLAALTARDAAAPGFGDVLTLTAPRTDDVLAGVTVPVSGGTSPAAGQPSHLEEIWAELQSRKVPAGGHYLPRRCDRLTRAARPAVCQECSGWSASSPVAGRRRALYGGRPGGGHISPRVHF